MAALPPGRNARNRKCVCLHCAKKLAWWSKVWRKHITAAMRLLPAESVETTCSTCGRKMRRDSFFRPFCSRRCQRNADDWADMANDCARDEAEALADCLD